MLAYDMKIKPGTLWNFLFALYTSNNDPKDATWTPSGSQNAKMEPKGAGKLPK